jgi:hypothetical protein
LVLKVSCRLIVFFQFEISVGNIVIDVLYSGAEARDDPENCLKLNNAFYNHLKHTPFLLSRGSSCCHGWINLPIDRFLKHFNASA